MTQLIPNDDAERQSNSEQNPPPPASPEETRRASSLTIYTKEECAAGLTRLIGPLAVGILKPGQANAMRAVFQNLLTFHERNEKLHTDGLGVDADVLRSVKNNPKVLAYLAPFLSPE